MMTRAEIDEVLGLEPWLRWYVEPEDVTMDDSRVRFLLAQRRAVGELRAHKETIEIRLATRGLLTTAYVSDREGVLS
jgi:hypothetical protein